MTKVTVGKGYCFQEQLGQLAICVAKNESCPINHIAHINKFQVVAITMDCRYNCGR